MAEPAVLRGIEPPPSSYPEPEQPPFTWKGVRLNVILFVLTTVSVFVTGGWQYGLPLMAILLAHEFGHYFAARYHGVPASLPYFIPFPLSLLGTMGAVIGMQGAIRSRTALLDIGASGPLAGMVVAVPVLLWGLARSSFIPDGSPLLQEGQSLFYSLAKWIAVGPIPEGHDVLLHPTALAGWAGLLITMLNLVPFGQLDGGHIAYALLGERQNRIGPWMRRALLPVFVYNLVVFAGPMLLGVQKRDLWNAFNNSFFWLLWFLLLGVLERLSGKDHPPYEHSELSTTRKVIGWFSLALFIALFMPTPISQPP